MNKISKILMLILISVFSFTIFAACGFDADGNYYRGGTSPKTTTATPAAATATVRATAVDTPAKTPSPTVKQTEPPYTGSLDISKLSGLSNTKLSWWLRLNDTHSTPEIDASVRSLIDNHAGYYTGDTSQKVIYLTFDEGYENGYTAQILDALKANGVKGTFFITMSYFNNNPELVARMVNEGHVVGNHSVTHPSFPDLSYEQIENELNQMDAAFYGKFGKHMKYFRPPMGEYSEMTLEAARQLGYKTIFWSFGYNDWDVNNQKGPDNAYNVSMANHHNGAVFLLHAVSSDNAGALDRIIKGLRDAGYTLKPLDL